MRKSPEHMEEIGKRMERAREERGLTPTEMLKELQRLKVTTSKQTSVISRWENGKMTPSRKVIAAYAEVTGRPADWFWLSSETGGEVAEELAAALVRIFGDVMAGRQPDEAYDNESGMPTWLNPRLRAWLRENAQAMREKIVQYAGRPWDAVEGAEKQRILSEFVRMLLPEEDLGMRRGEADGRPGTPPLGLKAQRRP